jgi:ketosteroid isomerase-like protein
MNRPLSVVLCAGALIAMCKGAVAGEDPKVAAEVIAITRAQWAAEAQGKSVAEQNAVLADDYTEFNRDYPVRLDGKALNSALTEALARSGDRTILGDMQNAKVQVYGDVAILTYNYVGVDLHKDGKTASSVAKSTRVYVRSDGQWKLVHANFAPVPPPES